MTKNKQIWKMPLTVLLAVFVIVGSVRHFHIKNFKTIEPGVLYTSGQPRGMDYTRLLYKYHIATFVNVRLSAEHREQNWYNEELTWVRNNGVDYVELPVQKRPVYFPDEQTQARFLEIMADQTDLPVLLHSSSGKKRVSMLTAVWLIKSKRYSTRDAIKVVEHIKEGPATEKEKEFIRNLAS